MNQHPSKELPIRSKLKMKENVGRIIQSLHEGNRAVSNLLIEDLKGRSLFFDAQIQQDVLIFAEQIQFQSVYDPDRNITPEIQRAADRLMDDLGFTNPEP
jgi:hypothetical protein